MNEWGREAAEQVHKLQAWKQFPKNLLPSRFSSVISAFLILLCSICGADAPLASAEREAAFARYGLKHHMAWEMPRSRRGKPCFSLDSSPCQLVKPRKIPARRLKLQQQCCLHKNPPETSCLREHRFGQRDGNGSSSVPVWSTPCRHEARSRGCICALSPTLLCSQTSTSFAGTTLSQSFASRVKS